jgi:predicted RNA-binding Zn ribbon-like protein
MDIQLNDPGFDFDAGELCLDFANTADWHASPQPQERLKRYSDLLSWGRLAGILSETEARDLWQTAQAQPSQAEATLARAIDLREAIYRIFVRQMEQQAASQADLETLNAALKRALPHLRVLPSTPGFTLGWADDGPDLERTLWPVAWSAAELITSERLERVGQCADDRGCGYLFYDISKNHSRRWCSMESCGNRAKAMRHYERKTS